ncbi:MAG TPA: glutathione S-transferase N-terminal domain-containing protein, partial [Polyangiales bacterium]|nr:glutathione S-transferase N-terminal domain-containing protein [Polyangiales bacterium]
MRLFSFWRSSSAWRVRIVLHYKRIPFEYVALNIAPGADEQHRADFDKINPLRQVPTLEWRDAAGNTQLLTQSVAIAEWLEEATPS